MVRPDETGTAVSRCIDLAGASPARVSAGAPGSRPRTEGEIPTSQAGRQEPPRREGARKRAATQVNATAPTEAQPKGGWEGRAARITAKATDSALAPERVLDLPGVEATARFQRSKRNRRGPPRRPTSGSAVRISAEREIARCREGVGGGRSTREGSETDWREGPLLWSGRRWR